MRLTAFPPPPPTPTTFMRAFCVALSSNSKIIENETPLLRSDVIEQREGELQRQAVDGSSERQHSVETRAI